ncbi:hypothetical protein ACFYPT_04230 [Streptomyces sp. NPDC005529]|uniref:hypothetical protein n=1 Tax=unclassified Streptomyces TaxID=2593676 RepID=UPI0033BAA239
MANETPYMSRLKDMAKDAPRVALSLAAAQARRQANLTRLAGDIRFAGIDELLARTQAVIKAFEETSEFSRIVFMIERARDDFATALEAALSGYFAVASDSMRDVMEIQHLLMDFAVHPEHADEWLTTDEKARWNRFSPGAVRKRLKAAGIGNFGDKAVSMDYKGHSMALHVSPVRLINSGNGMVGENSFLNEAGFWEIFDHARAFWGALRLLTERVAPGSKAEEVVKEDFTVFLEAVEVTEKDKQVWLTLHATFEELQKGNTAAAASRLIQSMVGTGILDIDFGAEIDEAWLSDLESKLEALIAGDNPVARNAAAALHKILTEDTPGGSSSSELTATDT